jgi:hypothetical protein
LGIYFFCVSKLSIYLFNIEGKIGQLTVIRTSSFINQAINHLRDALYDGVYRFSSELVTFGFKNDLWSSFNVKNILTTSLPILFQYCYKYCYSDSRNLWAAMKAGGLALYNLIQPNISLEMPVPSQGHYGFHIFSVVDWFCLFIYLWVLTFPLEDCSEFGNFVITLI